MLSRLFWILAFTLLTSQVQAQETTIGGRIQYMLSGLTGPFMFLISIVCLVGGAFLILKGVVKLKDSGQGESKALALFTIMAGTILVALPQAAGVGITSLAGDGMFSANELQQAKADLDAGTGGGREAFSLTEPVKDPENCLKNEEAVTCVAENLAMNMVPVGVTAVFVAVFIAGLWGFGTAIMDLAKGQPGGRAIPDGWWGKLVFNILLMNGPILFTMLSQTILGRAGTIENKGLNLASDFLKYEVNTGADLQRYEQLIGYLFIILALFGAIAFVRGIMVMKSASDGRQGATIGHGLVFVVAGVLLANAKFTTCTVLFTVGLDDGTGFGFCGVV